MAVRLVCRACGKRLKLPDGLDRKRVARCPKCLAPVDLTPALEASAYQPTVVLPRPVVPVVPPAPRAEPKPAALIGDDDPLPYLPAKPPPAPSPTPSQTPPAKAEPPTPKNPPERPLSLDDDAPLSLDDDPTPDDGAAEPEAPFRTPVWVLADSLRQIVGPCFAVFVSHGMFLEHEPMKPFLYVPAGCGVDSPGAGELLLALPDKRAVTVRFAGRARRALARDARAFLAGDRPAPVAAEYRRPWWMLWAALIFALGLAGGPVVLSQIADLGLEFGLQVGAGFAGAGLLANAAIVLFSRRAVPVQLLVMAGVGVLVTGVFVFGAAAYLAGRQRGAEAARADPPPAPPVQPPAPPPGPSAPPDPGPRPPSHLDRARSRGVSVLEDGPAPVTALALAADKNTLGIGYADGTTRLWPLDQPTFDAMLPGPKADAPVLRVQFDGTSQFVFATTATAAIGAARNGPFATPVKIPGAPVAIAPDLTGDRVRYAAVRGNTIQHRFLAAGFVANPPAKKDKAAYVFPAKGDEIVPGASGRDPAKPNGADGPTFLAWGAGNRLFAGLKDGGIAIWSETMRPEPQSRDHKAAVKVWARADTGEFATGDEQGNLGLWPAAGGKPTVSTVLATPLTALSFAPSGARLAVADGTGWLVIWDVRAGKALHRVKQPAPVTALAYGPADDIVILAVRNTVEVWSIPHLTK